MPVRDEKRESEFVFSVPKFILWILGWCATLYVILKAVEKFS